MNTDQYLDGEVTRTMRWEFFPMSFYTTTYDYRKYNLPVGWNERFVRPVIEKDIKNASKHNPDWQCDVITNFHKKRNCLDRFRGVYNGIIHDYLRVLKWNKDIKYTLKLTKLWYNVYPPYEEGKIPASQEVHTHHPDHFSFIHYLEYDPECHKPTVFKNPHFYSQMFDREQLKDRTFQDNVVFNVKQDGIVCFPSFVPHYVPRNMSNKRRITVAFNAQLISHRMNSINN